MCSNQVWRQTSVIIGHLIQTSSGSPGCCRPSPLLGDLQPRHHDTPMGQPFSTFHASMPFHAHPTHPVRHQRSTLPPRLGSVEAGRHGHGTYAGHTLQSQLRSSVSVSGGVGRSAAEVKEGRPPPGGRWMDGSPGCDPKSDPKSQQG